MLRVDRCSYWPLVLFGLVGVLALFLGVGILAWVAVLCCFMVLFFYRDPKRDCSAADGEVLSPADGTIVAIYHWPESSYGDGSVQVVRIFLSLMNVHINRSPITGVVVKREYFPGKHLVAFHEKASLDNERLYLQVKNERACIGVLHIAGLVARRIVCRVQPSDSLTAGERYGLIKLGSCVEVYLPEAADITCQVGQAVVAGVTVLGRCSKTHAEVPWRTRY